MAKPKPYPFDPLEAEEPAKAARAEPIGKDPTRQVTASQYNEMLRKEKADSDAKYQRYKTTSKNLGKYLYPRSKKTP